MRKLLDAQADVVGFHKGSGSAGHFQLTGLPLKDTTEVAMAIQGVVPSQVRNEPDRIMIPVATQVDKNTMFTDVTLSVKDLTPRQMAKIVRAPLPPGKFFKATNPNDTVQSVIDEEVSGSAHELDYDMTFL